MTDPVRISMKLAEPYGVSSDISDPMPRWLAHEILVMWIPSVNVRWHPGDRQFGVGLAGGFPICEACVVEIDAAQEQAA